MPERTLPFSTTISGGAARHPQFRAEDGDLWGRFDAESHPLPLHGQHRDGDAVSHGHLFPWLPGKDQHVLFSCVKVEAVDGFLPARSELTL